MQFTRDIIDNVSVKYGKAFLRGGTKHINALIEAAIADGLRCATVTGNWDMESHIRIPSDFTLILDGCNLKMADATFDNMFVNEHHGTEIGKTQEGTDRNIKLLGKNGATLYGGTFNGLSERTSGKNGMPHVSKNTLIFFTNVDGFETAGLALHNFRWWAMNHIFCRNGHIHDIDLKADDTCIDANGNVYHGLAPTRFLDILIKQADGIDVRVGCQNLIIENIRGLAEDDSVALTCVPGKMENQYAVEGLSSDICNITVRHIHTCATDACVRLLAQGGTKLHDILVEDVCDISDKHPGMAGRCTQVIRVNDSAFIYNSHHNEMGDCYNITIRNIRSRAINSVYLGGNPIDNFVLENVEVFDGGGDIDNYWDEHWE